MINQLSLDRLDNSGLDRLLAYFYETPAALEKRFGIKFEKTCDQLDYCEMAILETQKGNIFLFLHHERSPGDKYTKIVGNLKSSKPAEDLIEILSTLSMTYDEIIIPDEDLRRRFLLLSNSRV